MKIVGFTGSRVGMTLQQGEVCGRILQFLKSKGAKEFDHGLCIGSDEAAHKVARKLGFGIVGHPPENQSKMMRYRATDFIEMFPPKPYLDRNRDIVDRCYGLVATPRWLEEEEQRSGAWATIRYARREGVPIAIVVATGGVTYHKWPRNLEW